MWRETKLHCWCFFFASYPLPEPSCAVADVMPPHRLGAVHCGTENVRSRNCSSFLSPLQARRVPAPYRCGAVETRIECSHERFSSVVESVVRSMSYASHSVVIGTAKMSTCDVSLAAISKRSHLWLDFDEEEMASVTSCHTSYLSLEVETWSRRTTIVHVSEERSASESRRLAACHLFSLA